MIAKHVMNIHMNRPNQNADENGEAVGEIDIDKMKRYIAYCKRSATSHSLDILILTCGVATVNAHLDCHRMRRKC